MTTATSVAGVTSATGATTHATIVRQKPLMDMRQILLMNLGFFGIQYSFGMQQTAVNPIYNYLGANPHDLPLLNLAGPVTGLLIQPLIGALSDRTWSPRWGRRKPFFIVGAIGCSVCLFLFPFVAALWMAVLLLWLLDVSNNTAMEPYRAFIADRLPPSQLAKGFLARSRPSWCRSAAPRSCRPATRSWRSCAPRRAASAPRSARSGRPSSRCRPS
jgi:maltose/moltooligosaccharide transporter